LAGELQISGEIRHDGQATVADVLAPATAEEITRLQRAYFDGERLTAMPKRGRRRHLVLEQVVQIFEPGRRYPEIEVHRHTGGPVPIEGPDDRKAPLT
jgi:hypothetical protein